MNNFALIAKILKQYQPGSEDRVAAGLAISTLQKNYTGNLLALKLEQLLEEA